MSDSVFQRNVDAMLNTLREVQRRQEEIEIEQKDQRAAIATLVTRFNLLEQKAMVLICQLSGSGPTT